MVGVAPQAPHQRGIGREWENMRRLWRRSGKKKNGTRRNCGAAGAGMEETWELTKILQQGQHMHRKAEESVHSHLKRARGKMGHLFQHCTGFGIL
eukprot:gene24402-biopygen14947